MLKTIKLLGVTITNETEDKISEYVFQALKNGSEKIFITTPNPEILVYANSHLDYKDNLNSADIALPDGIGLRIASVILGRPLKQRISGVDFMEKLCKNSHDLNANTDEKPLSIGFLGGRHGVAERTADRLKKKYPKLNIVFVGEEWNKNGLERGGERGGPPSSARSEQGERGRRMGVTLDRTPKSEIDILFVAFGHPKQEEWIHEHLPKLPVKVAMGVGGSFDYLSGEVMRAPKFIRAIGLEWLFRLLRQPWRAKRQLSLITFIFLVFKEKLTKR